MNPEVNTSKIIQRLAETIEDTLSPERQLHIYGATLTSMELARESDVEDEEAVLIAGLAHDMAREIPPDEIKKLFRKHGEEIPADDLPFPALWHGNCAALLLKYTFGIDHTGILRAVLIHSTGDARMGLLEKIVFLADYIEPSRSFTGIEDLRALAHIDLDNAVVKAIQMKFGFLTRSHIQIHPRLIRAYEFYSGERLEKNH